MENAIDRAPSQFSLTSPFSQDAFKIKESLLKKEQSKQLSIIQAEKVLIKLHGDVLLQDDFPETFTFFESSSNNISLPENLNPENLRILINFLYLKEITPPMSISKTFSLLNLAVFFKVHPLTKEIQTFLLEIKKENEIQEIFQKSLDSYLLFQNANPEYLETFQQLLSHSMLFFIKTHKIDEIFINFNANFFNKLQNTNFVEKTFNFFVEIFKNSGVSNDILMEFLTLFSNRLLEYFKTEDKTFKKEKFYQRFIEKNLDLSNLDIKMIRNYTEKLKFRENFGSKDLIINAMSDNIAFCKREITELKAKITKNDKTKREITKKITKRERNKARKFFDSRLTELEERLKKQEEKSQKLQEITSKIFKEVTRYTFSEENNPKKIFWLSNSNMTVEITKKTHKGIRCTENPLLRSSEKKMFSIKIEKTLNGDIMYGFCVKTAEQFETEGYYATKLSFMLFLVDGFLWCRNQPIEKYTTKNLAQAAISNQIFSASLDVKQNILKFYLNGEKLGEPIWINLEPQEAEMMCPCVDFGDKGDKVSLVFPEDSYFSE